MHHYSIATAKKCAGGRRGDKVHLTRCGKLVAILSVKEYQRISKKQSFSVDDLQDFFNEPYQK